MDSLPMLGDLLVKMGSVDPAQLEAALGLHAKEGLPLGRALVAQRACSEAAVLDALSVQAGLRTLDLDGEALDPAMVELVPPEVARGHRIVPLSVQGGVLRVAVQAPGSLEGLDAVRAASGHARLHASLAGDGAIGRALTRLYGPAEGSSSARATVLLYGFPHVAAARLCSALAERGVEARVARALEVMQATAAEVVVAPLPAIEALLPPGQRPAAHLIVQGQDGEADYPRAEKVGARGFVAAPLDVELLFRAVRRFQPAR